MNSACNHFKVFLCFSLLVSLCSNAVLAQRDLAYITEHLTEQLPQEKVFLSFDKPQYTTGDNIYFKAFLMSARTHAADSLSGILYVDVINPKNRQVIMHQMLQVVGSTTYGSIETKTLKGEIVVHAYTQWMLNQASDYHFNKQMRINAIEEKPQNASELKPNANQKNQLLFFPEGGNLVAGLNSRVAFKATDEQGNGIPVSGAIVDEKGVGIVILKDEYLGMGSCSFTPVYGKSYTAKVKYTEGDSVEYILPEVMGMGYVMSVDNLKDKDNVKVTIQTNTADVAMPKALYLIAHTRGNINHVMQLDVIDKKNKAFVLNVPKEKLDKDGIVHITLFNDKGTPLAERLIFVENKKRRLSVNIKTDKPEYKPREKVTLNIEVKDANGSPCETEIAMTVFNGDNVKTAQYAEHLLSYTLLRADLGQNIETPTYYLEDTSRRGKRALDHLMMTNGWRRFVWKEILEQEKLPTPQYLPETGLVVNGNVSDNKKAITNASLLVTLFNEAEGNQPFFVESDKKGKFKLDNVYFTDSVKVFMQVIDRKKGFQFEAKTQSDFDIKMPNHPYYEPINQKIEEYIQAVKEEVAATKMRAVREIELQAVEIRGKKIKKADSRAIYGAAETTIEVDSKTSAVYSNLVDYLNGRGGINVYEKNSSVYFRPFRGNSSIEGDSQPLVMVDGFPMDASILKTFSMTDVERVDIVKRAVALYGARGVNGVVNVLTKTNNGLPKEKPKMTDETDLVSLTVKGYSMMKEFYAPDYSTPKKEHDIPDHRTSLYWSPNVKTDKSGKTQIIFYNSDDRQTVKILTETWQKDGKMGIGQAEYQVKE
jgi:hypothetical protein